MHPLRAGDFDYLCELVLTGETPWQWNGQPESVEGFSESLRSGVLCQYVIVSRRSGASVGLVRATSANFFHRHAYLSVYLDAANRRSPMAMEASALLVEHLFARYNLRKIYCETLAPIFEAVASGNNEFFDVEARFKDYAYFDGRLVDKLVLTIDRDHWLQIASGQTFKV